MKAKARARVGQVIYWLEDHSAGSYPQPPVECYGPVIALAADGRSPVVESHYDGRPITLTQWSRVPKKYRQRALGRDHRKTPKIVGGRRRR